MSIPIQFYTPIYYHIILMVVLITFIYTQTIQSEDKLNISLFQWSGFSLLVFVLLYMGLRPIHGVFVDMKTYASLFESYKQGHIPLKVDDPFFKGYMQLSSKIMSVQTFFFISAMLYIVPLYMVTRKWFKDFWFYAFLLLVGSFSFWAYGVNGIRNGIATSLFLLGISRDKRLFQILWIIVAIGFHKSMLLPAFGFILASVYNQPKMFLMFWLISIPLSIIFGGFWEHLFANLGFDDRLDYLTKAPDVKEFSHIGFRWDFLLYSSTAVFAGWYYIFKNRFEDKIYFNLYNTYLFTNAFWILVIRANFSNRFAYLSWFMMALVIIYPLLKQNILVNQYRKIGLILISYYAFTYVMAIFLK